MLFQINILETMTLILDRVFVIMSRLNNYSYEPVGAYTEAGRAIAAADAWTKKNDLFAHVMAVGVETCETGEVIYDNTPSKQNMS